MFRPLREAYIQDFPIFSVFNEAGGGDGFAVVKKPKQLLGSVWVLAESYDDAVLVSFLGV